MLSLVSLFKILAVQPDTFVFTGWEGQTNVPGVIVKLPFAGPSEELNTFD